MEVVTRWIRQRVTWEKSIHCMEISFFLFRNKSYKSYFFNPKRGNDEWKGNTVCNDQPPQTGFITGAQGELPAGRAIILEKLTGHFFHPRSNLCSTREGRNMIRCISNELKLFILQLYIVLNQVLQLIL